MPDLLTNRQEKLACRQKEEQLRHGLGSPTKQIHRLKLGVMGYTGVIQGSQ